MHTNYFTGMSPVCTRREQRVTLLVMAVLLGVSIMAYQALQLLPLPLLYGIFLYIGVASLYGVQVSRTLHQWHSQDFDVEWAQSLWGFEAPPPPLTKCNKELTGTNRAVY